MNEDHMKSKKALIDKTKVNPNDVDIAVESHKKVVVAAASSNFKEVRNQDSGTQKYKGNLSMIDVPIFNNAEVLEWVQNYLFCLHLYQTHEIYKTNLAILNFTGDETGEIQIGTWFERKRINNISCY